MHEHRFVANGGGIVIWGLDTTNLSTEYKLNINYKIMNEEQILQEPQGNGVLPCVSGSVILRDLCIGNLVTDDFYDSLKNITKIDSIDERGINLEIKDDGNYSECAQRCIGPYRRLDTLRTIPISAELLLKLGAIQLDFKDFLSFNLYGLQIYYIDGLWIEYVSRIEIKGLHHLQNIFYFRYSEDLAVSVLTDQ